MVAMTGYLESGSNSLDEAPSKPTTLRAYSITMHCRRAQAQDRELGFTGELQCTQLAFKATDTEAARYANGVDAGEGLGGASEGFAFVRGTQRILTLASFANPPARRASVTER